MVDKFTVHLRHLLADPATVWRDLRIVTEAVVAAHQNKGYFYGAQWSLSSGGRSWSSNSLSDLQQIASQHGLTSFAAQWDYTTESMMWAVDGYVNTEWDPSIVAKVYAGTDRMLTELAVKRVTDATALSGIEFVVGETEIKSTLEITPAEADIAPSTVSTVAPLTMPPTPVEKASPPSWIARASKKVGGGTLWAIGSLIVIVIGAFVTKALGLT